MIMRTNGQDQGQVPVNNESALRRELFSLLSRSKTSVEQDLKVLTQFASHIRNTQLIEKIAKACKLKLSGFLVNDTLELYYDLKQGREEMGYISKGWEDPGFRLGDLITVPRSKADRFKTCLAQIQEGLRRKRHRHDGQQDQRVHPDPDGRGDLSQGVQ